MEITTAIIAVVPLRIDNIFELDSRDAYAKREKGKAVLFFNLNDDNTNRRDKSFHAGLPPNTGEKWMCNKWIRMNKHT